MNAFYVEHNHATYNGNCNELCDIRSFKGHSGMYDVIGFYDGITGNYNFLAKHQEEYWNITKWYLHTVSEDIFTLDDLENHLRDEVENDFILDFVSTDYDVFIEELHIKSDMQETTYQNERSFYFTQI